MIRAFLFSGSALSTLGFESPGNDFWVIVLSAVEALTVMIVVALLIGYLPTIYSSYQQREQAVNNLDELTGAQPDGIKVVDAYVNIFGPTRLGELVADVDQLVRRPRHFRTRPSQVSFTSAPRAGIAPGLARRERCSMRPRWSTPASISRPIRRPTGWCGLVRGPPTCQAWPAPAAPACGQPAGRQPRLTSPSRSSITPTHRHQQSGPPRAHKSAAWTSFAQHRVQYECPLMTLVRLKKPPRGARWTTDRDEAQQPLAIPLIGTTLVGSGVPKGCSH